MYGAAKLAAFHLTGETARAAGMGFAWLRLFAAYGPGDSPNWLIPSLISRMLAGERPQTTLGTQKWDYLYIDDAAEGVLAAAHARGATGAFNLSSDAPVPVRTVVETLRDLAAPGLELAFGEIPFGPNQIMHMQGSNERLRTATGWQPRTALRDGLSRTVEAARS
jgi:nucleoside-diphosphate-sugar epimerase